MIRHDITAICDICGEEVVGHGNQPDGWITVNVSLESPPSPDYYQPATSKLFTKSFEVCTNCQTTEFQAVFAENPTLVLMQRSSTKEERDATRSGLTKLFDGLFTWLFK